MFKTPQTLRAAVVAGLLAACAACSSTSGSASTGGSADCKAYSDPAGTDLMTPTVLFKSQVMVQFNNNCGDSACHGAPMSGGKGVFLGAEGIQQADAAKVYAGIVGKAGDELPTMPFVTAGDPSKSYLMHKLDGDQCLFDAQCAGGTCLAEMPNGLGKVLPASTRDIFRRWIAQGAKND